MGIYHGYRSGLLIFKGTMAWAPATDAEEGLIMASEQVAKWETEDLCLCCPAAPPPSGAGFVPGALMSRALTLLFTTSPSPREADDLGVL